LSKSKVGAASPETAQPHDHLASARRTLELEIDGPKQMTASLDGPFSGAVEPLAGVRGEDGEGHRRAGRVIVTGMGKSGHIGRKIVATLAFHRRARAVRPSGQGLMAISA